MGAGPWILKRQSDVLRSAVGSVRLLYLSKPLRAVPARVRSAIEAYAVLKPNGVADVAVQPMHESRDDAMRKGDASQNNRESDAGKMATRKIDLMHLGLFAVFDAPMACGIP